MRRIDASFLLVSRVLLLIYAAFVFAVWLSKVNSFIVSDVVIEGAHAVSSKDVLALALMPLDTHLLHYIGRNNALLYPKTAVEKSITALSPRIAHVTATFDSLKVLHIKLTEFTPTFLYCSHESDIPEDASSTLSSLPPQCYFADNEGYVFAHAPLYEGHPFVMIIGTTSRSDGSLVGKSTLPIAEYRQIRIFIDALARLGLSTRSVTLLDGNDVRFLTDMPWTILWSTSKDPLQSAENLSLVLESYDSLRLSSSDTKEVDLRFGNKIFYR